VLYGIMIGLLVLGVQVSPVSLEVPVVKARFA